jgi:two-component system, response regulator
MDNIEAIDILLVEDNPQDAELTIRALKKNNISNNIFLVEDGAEAIDFLYCKGKFADRDAKNIPRVVFLDLKLPKINGLEVLKIIKNDDSLKNLPVVIITSSKEDPDIQEAYRLNANSYVVKPIGFDQFKDAILNLGYYWLIVNQTTH